MYNPQEISNRIKTTAKSKNIVLKNMLSDCELGINLISHLAKGQAITYVNIISNSNNVAFGENSNVNISTENNESKNEILREISDIVSNLNLRDRTELLMMIYKYADEHKDKE